MSIYNPIETTISGIVIVFAIGIIFFMGYKLSQSMNNNENPFSQNQTQENVVTNNNNNTNTNTL